MSRSTQRMSRLAKHSLPVLHTLMPSIIASDLQASKPNKMKIDEMHEKNREGQPKEFRLEQNEPNPVLGKTTIRFGLPRAVKVRLLVMSRDGKLVRLLCGENVDAGWHCIDWYGEADDGRPLPSGSYQYMLEAESFVATRRLKLEQTYQKNKIEEKKGEPKC